jgi:hypothetical protein
VRMPTLREIYAGLHSIANDATGVAFAWHLAAAVAIVSLLAGFRPSRRVAAAILSLFWRVVRCFTRCLACCGWG